MKPHQTITRRFDLGARVRCRKTGQTGTVVPPNAMDHLFELDRWTVNVRLDDGMGVLWINEEGLEPV